jgi:hypothetical protein
MLLLMDKDEQRRLHESLLLFFESLPVEKNSNAQVRGPTDREVTTLMNENLQEVLPGIEVFEVFDTDQETTAAIVEALQSFDGGFAIVTFNPKTGDITVESAPTMSPSPSSSAPVGNDPSESPIETPDTPTEPPPTDVPATPLPTNPPTALQTNPPTITTPPPVVVATPSPSVVPVPVTPSPTATATPPPTPLPVVTPPPTESPIDPPVSSEI